MPMRIDPWGAAIPKDYARLMKEFGIDPFEKVLHRVQNPHYLMRRHVIFGHRDFGRVLDVMQAGKPFVVMTGLMPSGKMHLGHKMVIDQLIWYQERGGEIFLCVADMEAYSARDISFEEAKRLAVEEYLTNYEALGLKLERCRVYFQSKSEAVKQLAYMLAKRVNFSEMRAIYGFVGESNISHIFYPMIDISDILHPQLDEFGGPRPTIVPVGIDQDPHLRLARDVATRFQNKYKFVLPSSTYHRLMSGLTGDKMSSSKPETAIFLTDPPGIVAKKIKNAFTGGQPTAEEQRRLGGDPDKCVVYELCMYHLLPDDTRLMEVRKSCESGEVICGVCKEKVIELMTEFLKAHQTKRERARHKVLKFVEE